MTCVKQRDGILDRVISRVCPAASGWLAFGMMPGNAESICTQFDKGERMRNRWIWLTILICVIGATLQVARYARGLSYWCDEVSLLTNVRNYELARLLNGPLDAVPATQAAPPVFLAACKAAFKELQAKGYIRYDDLPLKTRDGRQIDVEFVSNIYDEDGVNVIQCNIRDITEHKKKEEVLRLREGALDEVSQGVFISDENRLGIYVNAAFTAMTGYEQEEILGKKCSLLQGVDTDPATVDRMRKALNAALPFEGEILNYRKDGTPFWNELSIAPIRGDKGGPVRFIGIQRDVTERKQAGEIISQRTAFFEAQANSSLDGIFVMDADGKKILQNRRIAELWKIPAEIAEDPDERRQFDWATSRTLDPVQFAEKVAWLSSNADETSRDEIELVDGTILDRYTAQTGVEVQLLVDQGPVLIERLAAEGDNTRADLLLTVDAGNLWQAAQRGLLAKLDSDLLQARVPANLRDADGRWFGISTRVRAIVYSTARARGC